MSRVFHENAELMHIKTKFIPVESASSITFVKSFHGPLLCAFSIIKTESPNQIREEILRLAIKYINDS